MHPGEFLREEFLMPLGLSARRVADMIGVPSNRISELVAERRAMTADTAFRLERLFGMPAHIWMGFQQEFDAQRTLSENDYSKIKPYKDMKLAS
ncbi:MAG: HigA family addiction module antidote protein [Rhizobiaceae bacterium]|nr:HigA family addiction module antidote protein [Rhizobiaceae bacterium]